MDVKEKARCLEQLKYLKREVDMLSQRIAELDPTARGGAGGIAGLPGGFTPADGPEAEKLAALRRRLEARRGRCMDLLGALYTFIDDIDDSLIRQILTYRYIYDETWREVAARIGEKDEQYPRRLHNRFLQGVRVPSFAEPYGEDGL